MVRWHLTYLGDKLAFYLSFAFLSPGVVFRGGAVSIRRMVSYVRYGTIWCFGLAHTAYEYTNVGRVARTNFPEVLFLVIVDID